VHWAQHGVIPNAIPMKLPLFCQSLMKKSGLDRGESLGGVEGRRIAVFFYGLFMDASLLQQKGLNPRSCRIASVEGFCLVIGARATLVPSSSGTVHGVVCSLTHSEVDVLYSEASVSVYRPEAVLAHLKDGTVMSALCFNLPVPPSPDERNAEYAARLRTLAGRIGLPEDYVSSIR
jgi:hypothetical protein